MPAKAATSSIRAEITGERSERLRAYCEEIGETPAAVIEEALDWLLDAKPMRREQAKQRPRVRAGIPEEVRSRVRKMLEDGFSPREVAAELGVLRGTVKTWQTAWGINTRGRKASDRYEERVKREALSLMKAGTPVRELSTLLSIPRPTLFMWRRAWHKSGQLAR